MSNKNRTGGDYDVGYGRPPKATQFRPGQSGNPKGRPKGRNNLKTDVLETLSAPVAVSERGKKKNVSTQRAALLRLREKALNGDPKALDKLLSLAQVHNNEEELKDAAAELAPDDAEIVRLFLQRHPDAAAGEGERSTATSAADIDDAWRRAGLADDDEGEDAWLQ